PRPSSTPGPSPTPIFATEADALAAATDAYAAYVRVSDQILMDGGADPDRLRAVADGEQLTANVEAFKEAAEKGYRSTGGTTFDSVLLQQVDQNSKAAVVVYLCEDVSAVDVVDASNHSVVSPSRPDRVGYEATFSRSSKSAAGLVLIDKQPWPGLSC
ncbi:MAG TPA: hypothetical protein VGC18_14930, partial [Lacisediminihabitans sp.]|uniref:hypothetical protein n=1 Tax=Lacisediminihabitans sp. TaxID=2787631 RepID=UPI002ED9C647